MTYKDRDIEKLKKYANKLGLKVYSQPYARHTGAAEYDGDKIILFISSKTTKLEIILSLLHELGHHLDHLAGNKMTRLQYLALEQLNSGMMVGKRDDLSKRYRKAIYIMEKNGIKYMSQIHKKLRLEIPLKVVKMQQELDLFEYKFLLENARFATMKEVHTFHEKMKKKYGK